MKISTKGRYGLRLLLDIAMHQEQGAVTLGDVAGRQGISTKYLWQVVNPLKSGGLVSVTRGAHGGFLLAKRPEDITLLEVVALLEGPVSLVDCVDAPGGCDRSTSCVTREIWSELAGVIRDSLAAVTLADIVRRVRARQPGGGDDYEI